MTGTSTGKKRKLAVAYSLVCASLIVIGAALFGQRLGTHRPLIHGLAILMAVTHVFLQRGATGGALQTLGLQRPRWNHWLGWAVLLGAVTAVLRFAAHRAIGLHSLEFYDAEFGGLLAAKTPWMLIARYAGFSLVVYLSVLVPGMLFCSVIQESFARSGHFLSGLFLQALAFGFLHCYMGRGFSPIYGCEAFSGALIYGVIYQRVKNLYVPAAFMALHLLAVTALLAVSG